ncbi:hypothetical protein [Salsipaludibacter albus]|uniref:hypothetical protein n=1 Tax=Salsipaludibacter albus TaxID=2849650 RepID=UPI001EE4B305|nr:hypothetical protein [Salsipaludibacter albus]MBY5163489.1 hypothetical protein [Salsipaludibacter albus]
MNHRIAGLVVAAMVIGLAACGTTTADDTTSSTRSTSPVVETASSSGPSPVTRSTSTAPSSPAAAPGVQVLAEQFTAFIGAGAPGDCDDSLWDQPLTSLPYVGLPEQRVDAVLGSVEPVCLVGFDLDLEITLAIALPDGTVRTLGVFLTGAGRPVDLLGGPDDVVGFGVAHDTVTEGSLDWWIRPDAPGGEYVFVAGQDGLVASGSVWVSPGTVPSLEAVPADDVAWRRFAVSGFPSGPAAFGVYRDTRVVPDQSDGGSVFELVADLGERDVDTTGALVLDVPVDDLVPGEWYCVDSPVLADRCAGGMGFLDPGYVPWE